MLGVLIIGIYAGWGGGGRASQPPAKAAKASTFDPIDL